jgi:16S rRNA processing protein RimM
MGNGRDKTADKVNAAARVLVGRISAAQGLRGEVRIASFTEIPEHIAAYGPLTDRTGRGVTIEALRVIKGSVLAARLAGVADRSAAEALKGVELYVEKSRLPAADDDEWYYDDLVGLRADGADGSALGKVVAVQNYGAGDLLEIRLADGGRTVLVPFTQAAVPEIDAKAGRIVVILPEEIEDRPD